MISHGKLIYEKMDLFAQIMPLYPVNTQGHFGIYVQCLAGLFVSDFCMLRSFGIKSGKLDAISDHSLQLVRVLSEN